MNYLSFFEHTHSLRQLGEFMVYIEQHPEDFDEVFKLVFINDKNIAWRVLWGCEKISRKWPEWFDEVKTQQVIALVLTTKHSGIRRIGLSIIRALPSQDPINVELLNTLYDWMLSPKHTIGVQCFSMNLLYKYVSNDEDLLREFLITIEQVDGGLYSSAFTSSRRRILNRFKHTAIKIN